MNATNTIKKCHKFKIEIQVINLQQSRRYDIVCLFPSLYSSFSSFLFFPPLPSSCLFYHLLSTSHLFSPPLSSHLILPPSLSSSFLRSPSPSFFLLLPFLPSSFSSSLVSSTYLILFLPVFPHCFRRAGYFTRSSPLHFFLLSSIIAKMSESSRFDLDILGTADLVVSLAGENDSPAAINLFSATKWAGRTRPITFHCLSIAADLLYNDCWHTCTVKREQQQIEDAALQYKAEARTGWLREILLLSDWWKAARRDLPSVVLLVLPVSGVLHACPSHGELLHPVRCLGLANAALRPALIWCRYRPQRQRGSLKSIIFLPSFLRGQPAAPLLHGS